MQPTNLIFPLCLFFLFALTACDKKEDCAFKSKYIYEPIVFDENCSCIVKGKVKYLKDCQTVALLDYGAGVCDELAIKTICVAGNCEISAGAYTEEIEIDCSESIKEGAISEEEATKMGI